METPQRDEITMFDLVTVNLLHENGDQSLTCNFLAPSLLGVPSDDLHNDVPYVPEHGSNQKIDDSSDCVGLFSSDDDDDDDDDDQEDDNCEIECISEDVEEGSDMDDKMPASMQSWSYLTSSGDDLTEYEWGILPGMMINSIDHKLAQSIAKTTDRRPSISQVIDQYQTPKSPQVVHTPLAPVVPEASLCSKGFSCNGFNEFNSYGALAKSPNDPGDVATNFYTPATELTRHNLGGYMGRDICRSPPPVNSVMNEDRTSQLPQRRLGSPVRFLKDSSFIAVGLSPPSKRRRVASVFAPPQSIAQTQEQQEPVPQYPPHIYSAQQVKNTPGYQYQLPPFMFQQPEHLMDPATTAAASPTSTMRFDADDLKSYGTHNPSKIPGSVNPPLQVVWNKYVASKHTPGKPLAPAVPLGRKGGRPVPPHEHDLRWNVWTVGNLEIRSTASGVGVKHLREVLFRDDKSPGSRRSKWTHERLAAEIMARRAQQIKSGEVVGRPEGFVSYQGWWFYIDSS